MGDDVRRTPRRTGRVSARFARRLEQYGASGRLLRGVREVVSGDDPPGNDAGVQRVALDPLTGLLNRRTVAAEAARLLAEHREDLSFLLLDLDDFTSVNDTWGHDTGDEVIIAVARRLADLAPAGARVARIGGDEFLVVLAGPEEAAVALAEGIVASLRTPVPVRGAAVAVSAAVGVAHARAADPAATVERLLLNADAALYRAKRDRPGEVVRFDASMRDRARDRAELEAALRDAVAHGRQLAVVYQPIVRLDTGRPVGAEALLRWRHPARGLLPPSEFLPLAEATGLIGPIDDWVRGEAIRQLAEWRAAGTVTETFHVSVNVSARRLEDRDLPSAVEADLRRYDVPAGVVALEIAETALAQDAPGTAEVLATLRDLGVRLLVDDFGTGYSTLGYLRHTSLTGVKIDRSVGQDTVGEAIMRAVVGMSASLGLSTVAEGVETAEQRDVLRSLGVTLGQGWLWGPPVPAAQFTTFRPEAAPAPVPEPAGAGAPERMIAELEELLRQAAAEPER